MKKIFFLLLFTTTCKWISAQSVGIGTATPAHRLSAVNGPALKSVGWGGALDLDIASAIAWSQNTS